MLKVSISIYKIQPVLRSAHLHAAEIHQAIKQKTPDLTVYLGCY